MSVHKFNLFSRFSVVLIDKPQGASKSLPPKGIVFLNYTHTHHLKQMSTDFTPRNSEPRENREGENRGEERRWMEGRGRLWRLTISAIYLNVFLPYPCLFSSIKTVSLECFFKFQITITAIFQNPTENYNLHSKVSIKLNPSKCIGLAIGNETFINKPDPKSDGTIIDRAEHNGTLLSCL